MISASPWSFTLGDVVRFRASCALAEIQFIWHKSAQVTIRWLISGNTRIVDRRDLIKASDSEIEAFITEHLSPLRKDLSGASPR